MSYYFYSERHENHMKAVSPGLVWYDSFGRPFREVRSGPNTIDDKPYTLCHHSELDPFIKDYHQRWGDVELIHEGPGKMHIPVTRNYIA